jgi:hypothetical protein
LKEEQILQTPQLTLRINLEISQELSGFPAIRVQEEMKLPPTDFMGMASLMKRFHDLIEEINKNAVKK